MEVQISKGRHNQLLKAVVESFMPKFLLDGVCLYVGDALGHVVFQDNEKLLKLGVNLEGVRKFVDVIICSEDKGTVFFVKAVTASKPMSTRRMEAIQKLTQNVTVEKCFMTAFPDFATYVSFADKIAWNTAVWIAEIPDRLIHYD